MGFNQNQPKAVNTIVMAIRAAATPRAELIGYEDGADQVTRAFLALITLQPEADTVRRRRAYVGGVGCSREGVITRTGANSGFC